MDMGRKLVRGLRASAPFWRGGAGSPSNTKYPGPSLSSMPSGILINTETDVLGHQQRWWLKPHSCQNNKEYSLQRYCKLSLGLQFMEYKKHILVRTLRTSTAVTYTILCYTVIIIIMLSWPFYLTATTDLIMVALCNRADHNIFIL